MEKIFFLNPDSPLLVSISVGGFAHVLGITSISAS